MTDTRNVMHADKPLQSLHYPCDAMSPAEGVRVNVPLNRCARPVTLLDFSPQTDRGEKLSVRPALLQSASTSPLKIGRDENSWGAENSWILRLRDVIGNGPDFSMWGCCDHRLWFSVP